MKTDHGLDLQNHPGNWRPEKNRPAGALPRVEQAIHGETETRAVVDFF
jgi:hypothetical protein